MSESIILPPKPELHYPFLSHEVYPVTNPFLDTSIVYLENWLEVAPNEIQRSNAHWGLDHGAPHGTLRLSPFNGYVYFVGEYATPDPRWGRGLYVGIDYLKDDPTRDGKHFWADCHLSEALVKQGDRVYAGQPIGRVGDSGYTFGPHSHGALGCLIDGRVIWRNPV